MTTPNLPPTPEHLSDPTHLAAQAYGYGINAQTAYEMIRRNGQGWEFLLREERMIWELLEIARERWYGHEIQTDEYVYIAEIHVGAISLLRLTEG